MPQSYGFLIHEKPNIIIVLPCLAPMLAGIISACRQHLNRNDNLMICILSHRWCSIVKELIKKMILCCHQEICQIQLYGKRYQMTIQCTAMISFKLLTFCKTLLNRICRRPALYKQQWEVSQIIKIERKKERYFWVKAQFFLVTFTLSSKNIVIWSQLNRTEPTL